MCDTHVMLSLFTLQFLQPISASFIAPQHNVTLDATEEVPSQTFYKAGPKDLLAVFFYTMVMILFHAIIQEFILDVSISNTRIVSKEILLVCEFDH